jgi:hypothetical protein
MLFEDTRCCTQCGLMGVTRHTCPHCPCNYCKTNGHSANKCETAQGSRRTQTVGNSADSNSVAQGPLSNPFSNKPRRTQTRLSSRQITTLIAGSSLEPSISANGDRSSVRRSESLANTSLSSKRKMEVQSENARKKINTTPTVLSPDLMSSQTDRRSLDHADVIPLLNTEVASTPRWITSF